MSLIKFDEVTNEWYRSTRFFMKHPPGESKQSRYSSLKEAISLNPGMPVTNPETGITASVKLSDNNTVEFISKEELESGLE